MKLITEKEAADFLRCSVGSLHKWRRTGGGPPIIRFVGKMVRYSIEDLEAFIRTKRIVPGSAVEPEKPKRTVPLDIDYGELLSTDLSVRTMNALVKGGIITIAHLTKTPDETLLRLHGFGKGCLEDVHRELGRRNLVVLQALE